VAATYLWTVLQWIPWAYLLLNNNGKPFQNVKSLFSCFRTPFWSIRIPSKALKIPLWSIKPSSNHFRPWPIERSLLRLLLPTLWCDIAVGGFKGIFGFNFYTPDAISAISPSQVLYICNTPRLLNPPICNIAIWFWPLDLPSRNPTAHS